MSPIAFTSRTTLVAVIAIWCCLGFFGCQTEPLSNSGGFQHQVTVLGQAPSEMERYGVLTSETATGCRAAWAVNVGSKKQMVVDGMKQTPFDDIDLMDFSPEGTRFAYSVKDGGKYRIVLDGVAGSVWDEIKTFQGDILNHNAMFDEPLKFSKDGKHFAYVAREGGQMHAVVDGVAGEGFNYVDHQSFVFSPDGKHYAYFAGPYEMAYNTQVIIDGVPKNLSTFGGDLHFSPDSKHSAYVVTGSAKDSAKSHVVVDGIDGPSFDDMTDFIFSKDGQHTAYFAKSGTKWRAVFDGIPGPEFDDISITRLFNGPYNPVGSHFLFIAETDGNPRIILDGKMMPASWQDVVFSPDREHMAYSVSEGGKSHVVVDNVAGPDYDVIGRILFSQNGNRVAYVASKDKKWFVVTDGKPGAETDQSAGENLYFSLSTDGKHASYDADVNKHDQVVMDDHIGPVFDHLDYFTPSPDGLRAAYVVTIAEKSKLVVQKGSEIRYLDGEWPVFSADGQHLAYVSDGRVVVDDIPGPRFDDILAGPLVCADGHLEYLAILNKNGSRMLARVIVPGFSPPSPDGIFPERRSRFVVYN